MNFSFEKVEKGIEYLEKNNLYDYFAYFKIPLLWHDKEKIPCLDIFDMNFNNDFFKDIDVSKYIYQLISYVQRIEEDKVEQVLEDEEIDRIIDRIYGKC